MPLYEQYPQVLAALNTLPTLQQRVGNRYGAPGALADLDFDNNQWAWGRIEGSHQVTDPARSTSGSQREIDVWKLQTGIDVPLYQSQDGSLLTGGVNFSYGKAKADIHSFFGDGRINSAGYGLGTSLTWYGNNGVYVDGQLQTMWFDSDLSSRTAGHAVASGNNGRGYTSAIEAGKGYALGNGLSLTPQMQVTYSRVDFDTFRDPFDSEVSLQEGDSLRGRIGVSLDKETTWSAKDGTTRRSHIYSHLDLHNEFLNGSKVQVSGVEFATRDERQSVG
ncbi:outer membrane autotransporter barrel domain protein, partial [Yersinia pestis PY-99]